MPGFVSVGAVAELPVGSAREIEHQGRVIALFNVDGKIFAMDGICPHAGGPLSEGTIEGEVVTCPWHGWQFYLGNGQNVYNAKCAQQCYEVRVEGDEILVSLP